MQLLLLLTVVFVTYKELWMTSRNLIRIFNFFQKNTNACTIRT